MKIKVWDLPLRIFHWALVISVSYAWVSVEILENMEHHFIAGYCVGGLLIFRVCWGFLGSYYSTFRSFIFTPLQVVDYIKGKPMHVLGHSPVGALSVFSLLTLLIVQFATGIFSDDEYYVFGPLNHFISRDWAALVTEIHALNVNVLIGFIILHVLTIVFYKVVKKHSLVWPMITGNKEDAKSLSSHAWPKALYIKATIICALSVLAMFALSTMEGANEYLGY